jgi:selenocysteine-specific elongation factor
VHVIGTAGHVDHGKSTLIERLTGIDPDRLAEEKKRGLTIDLGFAWLTLPSGREAGIVDVPGHERFVHNMLAGAGSIDAVIFVVAANEGWRPQSEEHLAILDLLGARAGVIALTKTDLVDPTELDRVAADVHDRLEGTVLASSIVVPVSATTGQGIDDLLAELDAMLERTPESGDRGRPRLFIDRSFSMKGAGTIVTGTLTGGRLRVDDELLILPRGLPARVRSIQTHKQKRDEATPGSRVALNLAGLDRHEARRGDAAVKPGAWRATAMLDVFIKPIRAIDHAVTRRGAFKVYLGSAEVDARLRFIEPEELTPGGEAFARIVLDEPIVAEEFDRFVLRDSGRGGTVAGGVVLDAHPARRRLNGAAARKERALELEARRVGGRVGLVERLLIERDVVPAADVEWLAGALAPPGPIAGFSVSRPWFESNSSRLIATLTAYHGSNPLLPGMPRDECRRVTGIGDAKLFAALIEALADRVATDGPLVRLQAHRIELSPEHRAARDRLIEELDAAAMQPPTIKELAKRHGTALVNALIDGGELVRFSKDHALTRRGYDDARRSIAGAIEKGGPMTASQIRDVLGTSRKYLIPLLEHLDAAGFTVRSGDLRSLA